MTDKYVVLIGGSRKNAIFLLNDMVISPTFVLMLFDNKERKVFELEKGEKDFFLKYFGASEETESLEVTKVMKSLIELIKGCNFERSKVFITRKELWRVVSGVRQTPSKILFNYR